MRRTSRSFLVLVLLAPACAARVPHTQPEDMSAQAHRAEAAQHLAEAERARQRIQQRDHGRYEGSVSHTRDGSSYSYRWDTERWIQEAEGIEHLAAAQALEREYAFACALIPEAEQGVSAIEVFIEGVDRVGDRAVSIRLGAAAGPPEQLVHRLRCHRARMAVLGLDGMRDCPLAVRGLVVTVRAIPGGMEVLVAPRDVGLLPEIERRARALLARARSNHD